MREHDELVAQRDEVLRLRHEAVDARRDANAKSAEAELLVDQLRGANERLVLATIHADEAAELETEGRRSAEALAMELATSERALRVSEEQFRLVANQLPVLAWDARPDGYVTWYNDRWFEYTGIRREDAGGWDWKSAFDPAELVRIEAKWRVAMTKGEPWEDVFRLRRHDGQYSWFLGRAVPSRDENGVVVRWFGTSVDVDEQKRAAVKSEAHDRAKDEFLAMLGHELRNPLAPILNSLELMALKQPDTFVRERAVIERQVSQLRRLIEDLVDISRISEGKLELRREAVELSVIVARAVEAVAPLAEHRSHQLRVRVPDGLVVLGDPDRLTQAFTNVLANAVKYTPDRGSIDVEGERSGANISIRCRDTGIGIAKEMLPHVFELFTQEERALPQSQGGLGLGLALVHRLITMHGGCVTVESEGVGLGSAFRIVLPAAIV